MLAYVGLGMLWLWERGWVACTVAAVLWLAAGGVVLGPGRALDQDRHARSCRPLDWDSPQTFSPLDRDAWKLVQDEADQGRKPVLRRLCWEATSTSTPAAVFSSAWPPTIIRSATNPLDDVPLVELLTALRAGRRRPRRGSAARSPAAT